MITKNFRPAIKTTRSDLETREKTSSRKLKKDAQIPLDDLQKSQQTKTRQDIDVDEREKYTDLSGCQLSTGKGETGYIFGMDQGEKSMKIRLPE
jgi:hypothetical protein